MAALPERFGKYHVIERLARGGMAEVYKVKTVGLAGFEKVQALKRILPMYLREQRFVRSFVDEARIAVELNHRNIVQVFNFERADGELFLAMELIEGIDLRTAMEAAAGAEVDLPLGLACYILGEAAAGLDYAHRKADGHGEPLGIVHCDVSPQNVMLSNEGYVKILDFGVARAQFSTVTQNRRLRGKPRYMAPEQTRGEAPTPATDVFALGIVAWELITGLPLFEGSSLPAILAAVRRVNAPRVDQLNSDVPAALAEAVARALAREPADRGTAGDLQAAFADVARRFRSAGTARGLAAWLREVGAGAEQAIPQPIHGEDGRSGDPDSDDSDSGGRGPDGDITRRQRAVVLVSADGASSADVPPAAGEWSIAGASSADRAAGPDAGEWSIAAGSADLGPSAGGAGARAETAGDGVPVARSRGEAATDRAPMPETGSVPALVPPEAPRLPDDLDDESGPTLTTSPLLAGFSARAFESIDEDDGAPAALLEKRRVVAICALIEGGSDHTRGELLRLLADVAYKRGAVLHSATENGLVALFGLEVAGEDDVASAMSYALDVIDVTRTASAAAEGRAPPGTPPGRGSEPELAPLPMQARIAARAGVVARRRAGGGYELVGDAVAEVRALARGAEPGKPLLAGGAGRLSSAYFGFREVPSRHRRRGTRVLELIGPRSFDERDRALYGRSGRFVGRREPLAALHRALAAAAGERRRVTVAISGPSGVGKSRLVAEFVAHARSARDHAPVVIVVAAAPDAHVAPFSLVIDLVQVLLNLPPGRGEAARGRLTRRLRHVLADSLQSRDLDEVVGAFELAMELRDGALIWDLQASADLRERLIGALRLLRRAVLGGRANGPPPADPTPGRAPPEAPPQLQSTDRPILMIIEDWHFADRASAEVLRAALAPGRDGAERSPELTVITTRPPAPPARHAPATRSSSALIVLPAALPADGSGPADAPPSGPAAQPPTQLAPPSPFSPALTPPARPALTATPARPSPLTAPEPAPLPDDIDDAIALDELAGDDLAALIRDRLGDAATPAAVALVEERAGGNPLLVEQLALAVRDVGPDQIPSGVRALIVSRVDRLRSASKAVLQYAAVIGPVVRVSILEQLLGPEIHDELDALRDEGFLRRTQAGPESADGELAFARGLIREVVYESLSARARRDTHAKVGALLAMRYRAERAEPPAIIAEHLEAGGELHAASAFWLRAGRIALAAFDAQAAADRFTRTLTIEAKIGEPASDAAINRRIEALLGREHASRMLGDYDASARDLSRAEALCEHHPRRLADVKNRGALRHLRLGDYATAVRMSRAAQRIASACGDERGCGEALRIRGEAYQRQGQYDRGLEVIRGARDIFRRLGATADEINAVIGIGRIQIMRARYADALDAYQPITRRVEDTGDVWVERIVQNHLAVIYMSLGEFEKAMAAARRSLEICRRYDDRAREGDNLSMCGIILSELGCFEEAAGRLDEALDTLARTRSQWSRADCLVYAGLTASRLGDHDRGLATIERALRTAREIGARYVEVNALVALAGVRLARGRIGDVQRAGEIAAEAAELAGASTLRGPEIQALSRQAEATWRGGDVDAALALSERALALLEVQRHVEGSEIEILYTHYRILRARGDSRMHAALARATEELERQLSAIETPAWRESFRARVAVNAALLAESAFAGGAIGG